MYKFFVFERLSAGSVYKLLAIGSTFSLVPIGLVFGVLALFGAHLVHVNQTPITGPLALVVGPLIGLAMALMATVFFGTACVLGLLLFSKFRPFVLVAKESEREAASEA